MAHAYFMNMASNSYKRALEYAHFPDLESAGYDKDVFELAAATRNYFFAIHSALLEEENSRAAKKARDYYIETMPQIEALHHRLPKEMQGEGEELNCQVIQLLDLH